MNLILINPQSNQQILLDKENPLIIGRNNVIGCFDKKVSRSHGRITYTQNGKVNLVALHTNPCFFMKNGVPPIRQLNKDEEETLNEGDCLGLLPNSYWFQISSKNVTIKKEPNSESCKDSEIKILENVKEIKVNTAETQNAEPSRSGSSDYSKRIGSPEFEKTRRLPLSMYETDEIKVSDKSSDKREEDKKIKKLKLEDTDCANQKPDIKCEEIDKEEPSTSRNCPNERVTSDNKTDEKTDTQENNVAGISPEKTTKRLICQYEHKCFRKNPEHKMKFCHPGDSDYVAYEKRPLCQYGEACCRRNRTHRIEFRHESARPPDSPSGSPSSRPPNSLGEERPPCFGGRCCLNQKFQHHKRLCHCHCQCLLEDSSSCSSEDFEDFWDFEIYEDYLAKEYDSDFASSPLPLKRRRKKVERSSDYEEENEDDLEDPFINDASSDEYVPSDLNSEEDLEERQEI